MLILSAVLRLRYPSYILAFAAYSDDRGETFSPPYNQILLYWFTGADGYYVCPHWPVPVPSKSVNFVSYVIEHVIEHQRRPSLLLEIKPASDFHRDSGRVKAISQVIQRLDEIGPINQDVQRLYAISAIGKNWRAGYVTKGNGSRGGQPVKGVAELNSLRSSDARCWNQDITSDASYDALQSIVDTIKNYAD
jgi:hypothetical protein